MCELHTNLKCNNSEKSDTVIIVDTNKGENLFVFEPSLGTFKDYKANIRVKASIFRSHQIPNRNTIFRSHQIPNRKTNFPKNYYTY